MGVTNADLDLVGGTAKSFEESTDEEVISAPPPRPTVIDSAGRTQTMIIRDVSEMPVIAGTYTITIFCSGAGTIVGALTVGSNAAVGDEQQCGTAGATESTLSLTTDSTAQAMEVRIMPIGATVAAVSYVVTRS